MRQVSYRDFAKDFYERLRDRKPLHGQIELTHRCVLRCPYCYIEPYRSDDYYDKELDTGDWKMILDQLYQEGCMSLTFTGGDPLLREDFNDLYLHARKKAFIITVFTNAISLNDETIDLFKKYRPFSMEITLNSLKEERFDALTGTKGNFEVSINNIKKALGEGLPIILKTNGMKINKDEVIEIKEFAKRLLGEKRYKFDTYITPALNGDKGPLKYRLSPEELIGLEESDEEIKKAIIESYEEDPIIRPNKDSLYRCNTWLTSFFIDPYGKLKFCHLTGKFSTDLTKHSFKTGFYEVFSKLIRARFKKATRCRSCEFVSECMACPARSFLEVGDEESPVEYFCQLARARSEQKERLANS